MHLTPSHSTQPAALILQARFTQRKSKSLWKKFHKKVFALVTPRRSVNETEAQNDANSRKEKSISIKLFSHSLCVHPRLMWLCRKFLYFLLSIFHWFYLFIQLDSPHIIALLMENDTRQRFKVPREKKAEGSEGSNDSGGCRWKITKKIAFDEISGEESFSGESFT